MWSLRVHNGMCCLQTPWKTAVSQALQGTFPQGPSHKQTQTPRAISQSSPLHVLH